jgi:MATE family multidrug resistance protein
MSLFKKRLPDTASLALPMILSRVLELLIPTHDFAVVGGASSVEMGYLGLGWAPWALCYVIATGLLSGASILFSQAEGKATRAISGEVFRAGFVLALCAGLATLFLALFGGSGFETLGYNGDLSAGAGRVFLSYSFCMPFFLIQVHCAQYLGARRRPWPEFLAMAIALGSNIGLNLYVEAVLQDPSAETIAATTSVARCLGATVLLAVVLRDPDAKAYGLKRCRIDIAVLGKLLRLGLPLAASFGAESAIYFVMALLAASLGSVEVAGFQAGMNTLNLIYMITIGTGLAAGVQSGRALGAANMIRVRRDTISACGLGGGAMLAVSAVLLFQAASIAGIYTNEPEVRAVVERGMQIASCYLVFESTQVILKMALRGLGDIWAPFWNMVVAFWVVGIPVSWFLAFELNLSSAGLFAGIGLSMFLACILNIFRFFWITQRPIVTLI